jgi:hypothetical protein
MSLHLLKLCVGCDGIADLTDWIDETLLAARRLGRPEEQIHTTRMVPRRLAELIGSGSLYWVIKGQVACRQTLLDIPPFTDGGGISRCHLVLEPRVVPVEPRPCRPFQGWRYLPAHEAPADLASETAGALAGLPDALKRELRSLGLI